MTPTRSVPARSIPVRSIPARSGEDAAEAYDVIIVGARAAGSATAMVLARAGHRVLVVDRAARGSDTVSTHALLRAGVVQLSRWGLLDAVLATSAPVIREVCFRYPDDDVTIALEPTGMVPGLVAPKRTVLDPILAAAAESAGARLRFGARVDKLVRHPSGRVTGIAGRDGDGRAFVATAPVTVGADGLRSFVARAVDAPVLHTGRHATAVAYAYFEGIETRGYEWCWAPGRAAGVIPTNDSQSVVFISVPAAELRATLGRDTDGGFHRVLDEVRPDVAARTRAARRVGRFRTCPGAPGHVRRSHGPGWALVGDAGYWKDPISAHGLTDALRDAELLATAIDLVLAGAASEADALGAYQDRRDELSLELFEVVDEIAGLRWTIPEVKRLLIGLSGSMDAEIRLLEGDLAARP